MTDPPNPRSPGDNEAPGDHYATPAEQEEEGAVGPDEFFNIPWDQVESDEELIDALGSDATITTPDLLDQVLIDSLSGDRDRIRHPELPAGTDPDAVIEEQRRRDSAKPPGPRTPPERGTAMSNVELAGQVAALGSSDHLREASAALSQADIALGHLAEQVGTVLSEGDSQTAILGAINVVRQGISDLTGPLTGIPQTCETAAAKIRGV
ncbi:hypothetical protein VA596_41585 [Amycolatopsis sp., V23-08]|uniref:Uncharacterized protein n=1 Tax=Amycolatopsis heterodermiae TaxID=3110235 RepID=A0ABU5RKI2_9PSEU|nr:hypothetical protein [Amycolatopsis sp., V23-08]MEA5366079.1 hypothetical protein [Amycolatopsis sp., V23-08]